MTNIQITTFDKPEKKFLSEFCPENRMFTTDNEVRLITKAFDLSNKNYQELFAIRNGVVKYYSERMKQDSKRTDRWISAMQSVTAVVDDLKMKRYGCC